MSRPIGRRPAAIRAARRWLHRITYVLSRIARVVLIAGAAIGGAPRAPDPPAPVTIEMVADSPTSQR
jgi:hypothetical protein